jgi:Lrp/AsnC family leucine-responsive transcriptional regulator
MPNRLNVKLDAYDRRILNALQRDGRLTNVQLADEIGLSASPCLRRVRHLEDTGVIRGYQAALDAETLGLGLTVFIGVKVDRHHEDEAQKFHQVVSEWPEVISAYLVVVPDLRAYDRFLSDTLLKMPSVRDIRSNFAIRTLKPQGPLPLGHLPV